VSISPSHAVRAAVALIAGARLLFTGASVATASATAQATGQGANLAPLPAALPRTHKPLPTGATISAEDLKTRLYIFADDSMSGRRAGTLGNVMATDYLAAEAKRIGLRPAGDNGTFLQNVPTSAQSGQLTYPMRNVVAILPGSDPALRHQYIVLGAHNDHLGINKAVVDHDSLRAYNHLMRPQGAANAMLEQYSSMSKPTDADWTIINAELAKLRKANPPRPDSINNGADDDGSGSVALLEIAEALAAAPAKPKRSILFAWHTAEELGMDGSKLVVEHPPAPIDSLVAEINVDMIGRGGASDLVNGGPKFLQVRQDGCLAGTMDTVLSDVSRRGGYNLQLTAGHGVDTVSGAILTFKSDDDSYAAKGIPFASFSTDLHPDYHQVTDEPQYIDYDHLALITNFLKDVTIRVANLDRRAVCRSAKR
jgi:hypothetical protein